MNLEVNMEKLEKGPFVKLKFTITCNFGHHKMKKEISEINIVDLAKLRFKFRALGNNPLTITTSLSMRTPFNIRDYKVMLKLVGKNFACQWECQNMYTLWIDLQTNPLNRQLEIEFDVMAYRTEIITFVKLYDDNDLTDFTLRTEEGSVQVHKACLAAHSNFLKTKFTGAWKEKKTDSVKMEGVTMRTLNHLKEYLYLGNFPASELKPLFLIARYYFIESLRRICLVKLAQGVTAENLHDLIAFACEHNVPELVIILFQHAKEEVIFGAQAQTKPQDTIKTILPLCN